MKAIKRTFSLLPADCSSNLTGCPNARLESPWKPFSTRLDVV